MSTARMWEIESNRFWTSATSVGMEDTYSSSCGDRVLRSSQMAFCSVMYFSRSSRNFWSDAGRSDHRVMGVICDCCLYMSITRNIELLELLSLLLLLRLKPTCPISPSKGRSTERRIRTEG